MQGTLQAPRSLSNCPEGATFSRLGLRKSVESLWDAFERLKTVDAAGNKRAGIAALLDGAAGGPRFRQFLEAEARSLTEAGNAFQIRHHEVGQEAIASSAAVDYLFHRLFALTQLLLAARGR